MSEKYNCLFCDYKTDRISSMKSHFIKTKFCDIKITEKIYQYEILKLCFYCDEKYKDKEMHNKKCEILSKTQEQILKIDEINKMFTTKIKNLETFKKLDDKFNNVKLEIKNEIKNLEVLANLTIQAKIISTKQIYILIEREFIALNKDIYKIGYTTKGIINRLNGYPKGSFLYATYTVAENYENEIINVFKNKFKQRTDIGNEYFEGNIDEMIKTIEELIIIKPYLQSLTN